jgi:flagellar hook protein FlgE
MAGRWTALAVVASIAVGACRGDDDPPPTTPSTSAAAVTDAVELSMDGEGFFVVRQGPTDLFDPADTFTLDGEGKLVTADGWILQGWSADAAGTIDVNQAIADLVVTPGFEIDAAGVITGDARPIGQITVGHFTAPDGLELLPDGRYRPTADSGLASIAVAGVGERGEVVATTP